MAEKKAINFERSAHSFRLFLELAAQTADWPPVECALIPWLVSKVFGSSKHAANPIYESERFNPKL